MKNIKVKNDFFAVFRGVEYRFVNRKSHLVLISEDPDVLNNGFEKYNETTYIRQLQVSELDTAYQCSTHARYFDIECSVRSCKNGQITLFYALNYEKAEVYGFTHEDRNEYVKTVSLDDVEAVWYEYDPILGFEILDEQRVQKIEL